jgi:hypothetical protein
MRLLVFIILIATAIAPAAHAKRELLSIRGIVLPEKCYVAGFKIDTWGVKALSVCHLPGGWTITAGKSADPSGTLAGEASLGVTFLGQSALKQLSQLFLIEIEGGFQEKAKPIPAGGEFPATFTGKISVGTYGHGDGDIQEVLLAQTNLVREPAEHCP